MQAYMSKLKDYVDIFVGFNNTTPIDKFDPIIEICFTRGFRMTLTLKEAIQLSNRLNLCIQDYNKIIKEKK